MLSDSINYFRDKDLTFWGIIGRTFSKSWNILKSGIIIILKSLKTIFSNLIDNADDFMGPKVGL